MPEFARRLNRVGSYEDDRIQPFVQQGREAVLVVEIRTESPPHASKMVRVLKCTDPLEASLELTQIIERASRTDNLTLLND